MGTQGSYRLHPHPAEGTGALSSTYWDAQQGTWAEAAVYPHQVAQGPAGARPALAGNHSHPAQVDAGGVSPLPGPRVPDTVGANAKTAASLQERHSETRSRPKTKRVSSDQSGWSGMLVPCPPIRPHPPWHKAGGRELASVLPRLGWALGTKTAPTGPLVSSSRLLPGPLGPASTLPSAPSSIQASAALLCSPVQAWVLRHAGHGPPPHHPSTP